MRVFITIFCAAIAMLAVTRIAGTQTAMADMILLGGKIVTIDARNTVAQALAIRDGHISAVGDNTTIRALAGPATQIVSNSKNSVSG
jgi:predicted amidohydrolase YtcJ